MILQNTKRIKITQKIKIINGLVILRSYLFCSTLVNYKFTVQTMAQNNRVASNNQIPVQYRRSQKSRFCPFYVDFLFLGGLSSFWVWLSASVDFRLEFPAMFPSVSCAGLSSVFSIITSLSQTGFSSFFDSSLS